jgi:hypothetical protein
MGYKTVNPNLESNPCNQGFMLIATSPSFEVVKEGRILYKNQTLTL